MLKEKNVIAEKLPETSVDIILKRELPVLDYDVEVKFITEQKGWGGAPCRTIDKPIEKIIDELYADYGDDLIIKEMWLYVTVNGVFTEFPLKIGDGIYGTNPIYEQIKKHKKAAKVEK